MYNSPTTPPIVCDYRLGCLPPDPILRPRCDCGVSYAALSPLIGEILVVKQKEVPNINPSDYKTFRLMAPSAGLFYFYVHLLFIMNTLLPFTTGASLNRWEVYSC